MVTAGRLVVRIAAVAATFVVAAAGCGGDSPEPDSTPRPVAGVQAEVRDEVRPAQRGLVSWKSFWELRWKRAPNARDYLVYTGTSEGDSKEPSVSRKPRFSIEVANGVSPRSRVPKLRGQQVAFTAAQLTVSVAARYPGGRTGPKAGPFAVGEPIR